MKVEVTNHKRVTVGSTEPGDVVFMNEEYYLVLGTNETHFVKSSDVDKRTMLAHLGSGQVVAPINNVYCTVTKSAKVTITL